MKEKQDELEIEKAKEALLKKQRPLEVSIFEIQDDGDECTIHFFSRGSLLRLVYT